MFISPYSDFEIKGKQASGESEFIGVFNQAQRRKYTLPMPPKGWHCTTVAILTSFYSMAQRNKIHFPRISLRILAAITDISTWHRIVCPQLSIKIMFIFITFISIDQLCRRWKGHKLKAWTVNSTCSKSPLFIGSRN